MEQSHNFWAVTAYAGKTKLLRVALLRAAKVWFFC